MKRFQDNNVLYNYTAYLSSVRLIIGLGNPGLEFYKTRHNIGFWFLDRLADILNIKFSFNKNFLSFYTQVCLTKNTIFLMKPMTYMNNSGESVHSVMKFYKLEPEEILVIHDELDFMPGQFKLKKNVNHAGHNGIKSIQNSIKSQNFYRLRIGIGHPRKIGLAQEVNNFVLSPPNKKDLQSIEGVINYCCNLITQEISKKSLIKI
ncbi:MAG: aminoacyl-tRNA hydrolase [Bordetella sp.]|nr:MAG: aminoacyl-tRNA hydrolase [Bordetella sp.]